MIKKLVQLVSVVVALAALLWLLGRIGWSTIATSIESVGWLGGLVLCGLSLGETALDGAALGAIVGKRLGLSFAVFVNSAGSTMNLVLPWESGEILKTGLLRQTLGAEQAIGGTLIWNYVFKLSRPAVSALTAVLACLLCRGVDTATLVIVCIANALAFLPYGILRVLVHYGAAEGLFKILRFIPGVRRHPRHWIEMARDIDGQVRRFWHEQPANFVKVLVYQAIARVTGVLSVYLGFRLLGFPYGFAQATLVYATMNVAEYVIAILPARVGVSEGTAFFVYGFLGLEPAFGVILSVVLRIRTILVNGLLTPFAFLDWREKAPSPTGAEERRTA